MKTISLTSLFFVLFFNLQLYCQEDSRYDIFLNAEISGNNTKVKLNSLNYNLSNYVYEGSSTGADGKEPNLVVKPEPIYFSAGINEGINTNFIKIFEKFSNKINGFFEVIDTYGKNPSKKIEFKNASIILNETYSQYNSGNSTAITLYTNTVIINGISIFSK